MLEQLQRETFEYFMKEANDRNGLIADRDSADAPASIAAVGLGLTALIVGIERGYVAREAAVARTLTTLRFFRDSPQGPEIDATGYKGFYYHFLDMQTGRRVNESELSTIDTALLVAGILSVAQYFAGNTSDEREIRDLAEKLYERVDWRWALNGQSTLTHGWKPESGFLLNRWNWGYSEAMILYLLALGSPTFAIEKKGYDEWTSTFEWKTAYGIEYIYAGPLFIHQLSHVWIDFRGLHDECNQKFGLDYFENSRRATCVQQKYAIENPRKFKSYGAKCWGFTASDGPGPRVIKKDGKDIIFYDYIARGAPYGPDDGTVSPWAVLASIVFAPELVIETIEHAIERLKVRCPGGYGLEASFNPTFAECTGADRPWVSPCHFGLNQGPDVVMIENHLTGLVWRLMRGCAPLQRGLERAGFIRLQAERRAQASR